MRLSFFYCRAPKREANKRRTGKVLFDLGVCIFVCNAWSVTLGKDRHIHIRIYACAHGHWQCQWQWTEND